MIVNATVSLYYSEGGSISSGWESLWMYVKFKEKGNVFKTKLGKSLVSTFNVENARHCDYEDRIDSYDDYYRIVNEMLDDKELLKGVAVEMIEKHFVEEAEENSKDKSKEDLVNRVRKTPKLEITVEIK